MVAGSRWVGWYNDSRDGEPVEILFEFDTIREFHAVHLHTNNMFNRGVQVRIIFIYHSVRLRMNWDGMF